MKTFSFWKRQENLHRLKNEEFDLFIIGGGINGAGVARDAAQRGMKVGLVEANDLASGTSSRSSKLIHGGIRYLAHLQWGLVFEALSERRILFKIAPHLVRPLKFILPVYASSKIGMTKMSWGMWLYDCLSLFSAPDIHEHLKAKETLDRLPLLEQKGLQGSFAYYDAFMDDARLVIETLRSASNYGAVIANFTRVQSGQLSDGRLDAVLCKDQITGEEFSIKSKHFVTSVGPWTDFFGKDLFADWQKILRPTKGIHLTFPKNKINLSDAVVMVDDEKNRIVFAIPREKEVIIGTTDTDFMENPENVKSEIIDVDYLMSLFSEYFPKSQLKKEDIIASYSGVRPLVADNAESEGQTSREHKIWSYNSNVTFVAGGKYTTYRKIASEVVSHCLRRFSLLERVKFFKAGTKIPLNPKVTMGTFKKAVRLKEDWVNEFDLSEAHVEFLIKRHGYEAYDVMSEGVKGGWHDLWQQEAQHAIFHGMCLHLIDFYLRRTSLFISEPDHGMGKLEKILDVFKFYYGWTEERCQREIKQLKDHIHFEMGWRDT